MLLIANIAILFKKDIYILPDSYTFSRLTGGMADSAFRFLKSVRYEQKADSFFMLDFSETPILP